MQSPEIRFVLADPTDAPPGPLEFGEQVCCIACAVPEQFLQCADVLLGEATAIKGIHGLQQCLGCRPCTSRVFQQETDIFTGPAFNAVAALCNLITDCWCKYFSKSRQNLDILP